MDGVYPVSLLSCIVLQPGAAPEKCGNILHPIIPSAIPCNVQRVGLISLDSSHSSPAVWVYPM